MSLDFYCLFTLSRTFLQIRGPSRFFIPNWSYPPVELSKNIIIAVALCIRKFCHTLSSERGYPPSRMIAYHVISTYANGITTMDYGRTLLDNLQIF